ncbi:MAG: aminoacyl-histidine dipeptidase [Lawsonibacter sp.]
MQVLEHLEPRKVFSFFEAMCAIPHGSRNTKAISDWCVAFAKERKLEHYQDENHNVIIIKPAAPGYEDAQPIILQGHLDMVCETAVGCTKDMEHEGLDLAIDGDYVYAKGTTLGSDDGIAVAMAMAVLDDKDLPAPRIEAVFTTDEEVGLLGATALDISPLTGKKMINLDSEEEGIFTVSCAGGNTTTCILPVTRAPFSGTVLAVTVGGLTGGHSGMEIHKGRANSNLLMGRVLRSLAQGTQLRIQRLDGGLKDNAIPVETRAIVMASDAQVACQLVRDLAHTLQNEYRTTDPALFVKTEAAEETILPLDSSSTAKVICMLQCLPNGIEAMNANIPDLVQTSLNMGILATGEDTVLVSYSIRSSVDSQKQMLKERLSCLMEQLGGRVEFSGEYTGWQYQEQSPLRELMVEIFQNQYGKTPKIQAIHAGLECGIFAGKISGLDCVSLGPDLLEIHTPREKMSISSVQRVWKFLLEVLKRSR